MSSSYRDLFLLEDGVTYLNCAYMGPMLRSAEAAGIAGMQLKRHPWTQRPEDFFEPAQTLRAAFAQLIGAPDANRVALVPSVSYGMATLAKNIELAAGQKIVAVGEQFPSNVYCWMELAKANNAKLELVDPPNSSNRGKDWNAKVLAAIDSYTAVVAVPNVHWADGTLFDLELIGQRCREVGALLIIDGTQSIGALKFDVNKIRPDAVVCAGYKWLFGAYGLGLAWFGPHFDKGRPLEENWITRNESEDFAGLVNYKDTYQPGSFRYNMGEFSNPILIPMLHEGLKHINSWGTERIQEHCRTISNAAITELKELGFAVEEEAWRAHHLFGIRLPAGVNATEVKTKLTEHNIVVSLRGDAIRVSPHVYNTEEDMQALVHCLKSLT